MTHPKFNYHPKQFYLEIRLEVSFMFYLFVYIFSTLSFSKAFLLIFVLCLEDLEDGCTFLWVRRRRVSSMSLHLIIGSSGLGGCALRWTLCSICVSVCCRESCTHWHGLAAVQGADCRLSFGVCGELNKRATWKREQMHDTCTQADTHSHSIDLYTERIFKVMNYIWQCRNHCSVRGAHCTASCSTPGIKQAEFAG